MSAVHKLAALFCNCRVIKEWLTEVTILWRALGLACRAQSRR